MRINDAVLGLLIIGFSIFVMVEATSFPALPGVPYGPGMFPTIIASCMLLGGAVLVFQGLRRLPAMGWIRLDEWARQPRTYATLALIFTALLFYILVSDHLGFIVTAMMILFPLLLWTRGVRFWASSGVITVCFATGIYFIFAHLMRIPLPPGILQGIV